MGVPRPFLIINFKYALINFRMRKVSYNEQAYWEERYKQNVCEWYQWLVHPNQISQILQQKIPPNSKILQLGCGSSNLAEKLSTLQHEITAIDFSKQIIRSRTKTNSNDKITYKLHNILEKLPFEDGQFDVIIQKNTIDCLFCQDNFMSNMFRFMKECYRVLKNGGRMISITHGKEKNRKFFYRNRFCPFQVEVVGIYGKKANQGQILAFVLSKGQSENGDIPEEEGQDNQQNENAEENKVNDENDDAEGNEENEQQAQGQQQQTYDKEEQANEASNSQHNQEQNNNQQNQQTEEKEKQQQNQLNQQNQEEQKEEDNANEDEYQVDQQNNQDQDQ